MFDGLQNVLERCAAWYDERLSLDKAGRLIREDSRRQQPLDAIDPFEDDNTTPVPRTECIPVELPAGVHIYTAGPITDRKSSFVGRACRIQHPSEACFRRFLDRFNHLHM